MRCTVPGCPSDQTRQYVQGARCADHTPAQEGGRAEPDALVDPARIYWSVSSPSRSASSALEERHRKKGQTASKELRARVRAAND